MSDEKKTIATTTLAEAHEANVKSMGQGLAEGLFTQAGANFANDLSHLLKQHAELNGLQTVDYATFTRMIAPLVISVQGAFDLRGNDKRPGTVASLVYMMEVVETGNTLAKKKGYANVDEAIQGRAAPGIGATDFSVN